MIKNQWYVAEESAAIRPGERKRVKLCGLDFVLYRNERGEAFCLSEVCIHRGASLGGGQVVEGAIECPYHGWRFGGDGACVRIPSLGPDARIPARAKVDAYPVKEYLGWIWVFLGDAAEEDRPPFPDFPEYGAKGWRTIRGEFLWNANYARIVENGIDPSHAAFVHPSFGDRNKPEIHDFAVEADAHSAYASVTFLPPEYKGLYKLIRAQRDPVTVRNGFHVSGAHVRIEIQITASWRIVIYDVNTPIDETTTLTRWIMARNFMIHPMFDGDSRKRTIKIFEQDAVIMEGITPELLPVYLHEEVSVKSDAIMVAWRNKRRELIEKGWAIDVEAVNRDVEGKRAMVMPSPGRAPDAPGARDYLLKTVPMVDGERLRAEALAQRHETPREAAE
jgi:phenylpropionate dioxygenase-like ring-hydroxylating dioxygenase large terminal subunit